MRLYEHETKRLFASHGIPVPRQYGVVRSPEGFAQLEVSYPLMLKAAVLIGGRGKAGGIRKVGASAEARSAVEELFALSIRGYPVDALLVEEAVEFSGQCYAGATMDPATYRPVVIVSAAGGVDIEEVARTAPDAIVRHEVPDNDRELPGDVARALGERLAGDLGADPGAGGALGDVIGRLYAAFQDWDARLLEINPLLMTAAGPLAADAKLVLDDNALWRQTGLLRQLGVSGKRHDVSEATANERRAHEAGFPYVDLLPEGARREEGKLYVALVPGGAGYGIFSIDEVANVGDRFFDGRVVPVNFMDSGGGPTQERVAEMFHLLMDYELVDLIITSRFGGISSCDVFIRGLVQALRERHEQGRRIVPVYGRMVGTDLPGARDFMEQAHRETPDALAGMEILVGNRRIMVDVIREGVAAAFARKGWRT